MIATKLRTLDARQLVNSPYTATILELDNNFCDERDVVEMQI